jgi:hypothetical protein
MAIILANWEVEIGTITIQGQFRHLAYENPIFKITKEKWTRGLIQVVECLLCKHEILSLNPLKNNCFS